MPQASITKGNNSRKQFQHSTIRYIYNLVQLYSAMIPRCDCRVGIEHLLLTETGRGLAENSLSELLIIC